MGGYDYNGHYIGHWNESDPVADTNFPNIVELDSNDEFVIKDTPCQTETMEEVNSPWGFIKEVKWDD